MPQGPEAAAEVAAELLAWRIVTGGNRSRAEVAARAQRDNAHTANTGNSEPGQHGRIASAAVQPRGATVPRQQVSRTHGASWPGDTIRNGNNGGADVILTGGGLLPALAHGWRRRVHNLPIIPRSPGTVGKHLPALPAPPPSLLIYIISIYKIWAYKSYMPI